jgi:hypothetical protein
MRSMPGHFALLAGVVMAGALVTLYGQRWKRFETIGMLFLDVGLLICGIGTWFEKEHVLGLLVSILGGSDAFVQIEKFVKRKSLVAGERTVCSNRDDG